MFAKMTNFYHFRRKTMGGFFGVAAKDDCVFDLFFGIDYHSHLGTRRGGMTVYGDKGFDRSIHNIENAPFRTCLLYTSPSPRDA